jgi:hypothetical protein
MWTLPFESLPDGRGMQATLHRDGRIARFSEVINALEDDAELRAVLTERLAAIPYRGFKWETPAVTQDTVDRPFECVVLDSPRLACRVDAVAFAEHFVDDELVVAFPSLGRDAVLIAPCPRAPHIAYGHLAAFVRDAPAAQQHALWRRVGTEMRNRLGTRPVWLSTAGGGVAWLHVRLDDHPKYYGYASYRTRPAPTARPSG